MSELKNIRRARGLTQDELALAMNTTGVSISRYERDERKLTLPLLRRLSSVLECKITDIIGDDVDSSRTNVKRPEVRWLGHFRLNKYQVFHDGPAVVPEAISEIPFKEDWITSLDLSEKCDLVVVEMVNCGDAMSPMLVERDFVILDRNVRSFVRDGVYLILSGKHAEFRRLAKNPLSDCYSILSENPSHPDYSNLSLRDLNIPGLAVWHWSPV